MPYFGSKWPIFEDFPKILPRPVSYHYWVRYNDIRWLTRSVAMNIFENVYFCWFFVIKNSQIFKYLRILHKNIFDIIFFSFHLLKPWGNFCTALISDLRYVASDLRWNCLEWPSYTRRWSENYGIFRSCDRAAEKDVKIEG